MALNTNQTTDTVTPSTGTATTSGNVVVSAGDLSVSTVGKGLKVKEGSNAKMGVATLNGSGTVTVNTTAVTANSRIFLSYADKGTAPSGLSEAVWVSSITPGSSFVIKSGVTGSSNDANVNWLIIEPA